MKDPAGGVYEEEEDEGEPRGRPESPRRRTGMRASPALRSGTGRCRDSRTPEPGELNPESGVSSPPLALFAEAPPWPLFNPYIQFPSRSASPERLEKTLL